MRRTLALLVGLGLMAGAVEAQSARLTTATRTDTVVAAAGRVTYPSRFTRSRVRWQLCLQVDSVAAKWTCTQRTYGWVARGTQPPPPPPPADTTPTPPPPPPVDTTPKPPAAGVLFSSEWSTGERTDGGKWANATFQPIIDVVLSTGLGFPTKHVVRVRMGRDMGGYTAADWIVAKAKWTVPNPGESRAYRIYYRNDVEDFAGGWAATHSLEGHGGSGSTSGGLFEMLFGTNADGTFPWVFGTPAGYPRNYFTVPGQTRNTVGMLKKHVTYRFEWKLTRQSGTNYTLDLRIYDNTGTLVADKNTISAWGGGTLASNPTVPMTAADALTSLRFGSNGGFSAGSRPPQYFYWGGFAVCTDWCGAY